MPLYRRVPSRYLCVLGVREDWGLGWGARGLIGIYEGKIATFPWDLARLNLTSNRLSPQKRATGYESGLRRVMKKKILPQGELTDCDIFWWFLKAWLEKQKQKTRKSWPNFLKFHYFNPFLSLPSVATDERKLMRRFCWSMRSNWQECYWALYTVRSTKIYNKGLLQASLPFHSISHVWIDHFLSIFFVFHRCRYKGASEILTPRWLNRRNCYSAVCHNCIGGDWCNVLPMA